MQTVTRFAIMDPLTNKFLLPRTANLPQVFSDNVQLFASLEDRDKAAEIAGQHVQNGKRVNALYPRDQPMPTRLLIVPVQMVIEEAVEEIVAV